MKAWFLAVCATGVCAVCLVCASRRDEKFEVRVDAAKLTVELAADPDSRARGLMHRTDLEQDAGMLFVFEYSAEWGFWMKNTFIPLSIAFIREDRTILNIEDMYPHDTSLVMPKGPVRYALEVNKGWFAAHSIRAGARVMFSSNLSRAIRISP